MRTTAKMGLTSWDQPTDPYNYAQLAQNWQTLDFHDHSPGRGTPIAAGGLASGAVLSGSIAAGAVGLQHLASTLAQSAEINQTLQVVKGSAITATSQSTSSGAYTTLATPDQVSNLVLPTNGVLAVWYQATWQESVAGASRAAIFLNAAQLQVATTTAGPGTQAAGMQGGAQVNTNRPLASSPIGLVSHEWTTAYTGDVSTGQATGIALSGSSGITYDIAGTVYSWSNPSFVGGPCYIFAAAGTYNVSVQFRASSGSVTVSNRRLYARVHAFS